MKRIVALFSVVLIALFALPALAHAEETTTLTITADKTVANPGDRVNFSLMLGAVNNLGGMNFYIDIPEGLSIDYSSVAVPEGVMDILNADGDGNVPTEKNENNFDCSMKEAGYTGTADLCILKFTCIVNQCQLVKLPSQIPNQGLTKILQEVSLKGLTKNQKCAAASAENDQRKRPLNCKHYHFNPRRHTMTNPEKTKQILLSEIEKMNQHREDFCRHPGTDFTRDRKITFDTLLHFQISMESGSVNHELLKYFNFDVGTPSLSAFYQQRAKLSDDVFQQLFYSFNGCFRPKSLLKGRYQLLACDGSGFTFTRNPKDTESYYDPSGRSEKGYNQMYLVPLYDLLNKTYTDAVIQPMRKRNEFAALYELIDRHTPCSGTVPVFIADRGFHAYNVFAHAIENGAFFVIRATDTKMKRLLGSDLPREEAFDIRVTRYLTRSHSKKKYLHPESADQYRCICQKVAFDYLPDEGYREYEISLRVLRFPIGNGTYENIITNLPGNEFCAEEIKEIYHLRWGIETSFCTLKHAIAAVNFHSKSRQMITHEIWARLILFNFCSYITGKVTFEKQKRKHVHQVDFSIAFKACRHFLRLHSGEEPPDVEDLIKKHTLPIRPDRNFARQQRFQVPVSFTYRF